MVGKDKLNDDVKNIDERTRIKMTRIKHDAKMVERRSEK